MYLLRALFCVMVILDAHVHIPLFQLTYVLSLVIMTSSSTAPLVQAITYHAWNKDQSMIALSPNNHEIHIYKTNGQQENTKWEKKYVLDRVSTMGRKGRWRREWDGQANRHGRKNGVTDDDTTGMDVVDNYSHDKHTCSKHVWYMDCMSY